MTADPPVAQPGSPTPSRRTPQARGWALVRTALAAAADLAAPLRCGGCDGPGRAWCPDCATDLADLSFPDGPGLLDLTDHCRGCPPTWAACTYDGVVRTAVVAVKDRGRADLVGVLAPLLAGSIRAAAAAVGLPSGLPSGVFVVPVPSSAAARRRRGEDPLRRLTRAALTRAALTPSASTGTGQVGVAVPPPLTWAPALAMRRRVLDQAGLDRSRRLVNLVGAVEVRSRWRGAVADRPCLLVDDVVTSGATLAESARALRVARAGPIVAATLAQTPAPTDRGPVVIDRRQARS